MIEDWRYNDGNMMARQFCLNAFINSRIDLSKNVYEFCHNYVSEGRFQKHLDDMKSGEAAITVDWEKKMHQEVLDAYSEYLQSAPAPEHVLIPLDDLAQEG